MAERLFFALWPGQEQRWAFQEILAALPRRHGREPHPDDLHMTLAFLGEIASDRRACLEQAADRVRTAPFLLLFDRVGYWPRSRILWCGASDRPAPLLDLLAALNGGLRGCGLEPDRRAFAAHVTLARKAPVLGRRDLDPPLLWSVDSFVLAASHLGERPSYQVLRRWPLVHDAHC
jgi:RNA 2',3'-cyclic 3'-phosphodiesterase